MVRTRGKYHYRRSHHPPSCLNREKVNGAPDRLFCVAPPAVLDLHEHFHPHLRCESLLLSAQSVTKMIVDKTVISMI